MQVNSILTCRVLLRGPADILYVSDQIPVLPLVFFTLCRQGDAFSPVRISPGLLLAGRKGTPGPAVRPPALTEESIAGDVIQAP